MNKKPEIKNPFEELFGSLRTKKSHLVWKSGKVEKCNCPIGKDHT